MVSPEFQSKDVAWQKKSADLAPPIGQEFVGPNRATNNLIDIFRRLILAVDFLVFPVGEFGRHKAGMPGQPAELSGLATDRAVLADNRVLIDWVCIAISLRRMTKLYPG